MKRKYYDGDFEGNEILNSMSHADRLNLYFFEQLKPFIGSKNLEIGSGIGNISSYFVSEGKNITLSEINPEYRKILTQRFDKSEIVNIDLNNKNYAQDYAKLKNHFDLVYAFNVIEHIEDDILALRIINFLTKKDGHIVILVPAYSFLFNHFDKILGHFRRYTKYQLIKSFPNETINVKAYYLNFLGIFAWYLFGKILKRKTINESNMKLYNIIMPIVKFFDFIFINKIGLSTIAINKKI